MLPAKEFFGNSLDELRAYFGVTVAAKPEIKREHLEGGCVLLEPECWRSEPPGLRIEQRLNKRRQADIPCGSGPPVHRSGITMQGACI